VKDVKPEGNAGLKQHVAIYYCWTYDSIKQMLNNAEQHREFETNFHKAVEACQLSPIKIIDQGDSRLLLYILALFIFLIFHFTSYAVSFFFTIFYMFL